MIKNVVFLCIIFSELTFLGKGGQCPLREPAKFIAGAVAVCGVAQVVTTFITTKGSLDGAVGSVIRCGVKDCYAESASGESRLRSKMMYLEFFKNYRFGISWPVSEKSSFISRVAQSEPSCSGFTMGTMLQHALIVTAAGCAYKNRKMLIEQGVQAIAKAGLLKKVPQPSKKTFWIF